MCEWHEQCDNKHVADVPVVTSSHVGNLPIDEIDAACTSSLAALQEMKMLGPSYAIPLLQYGLSVYNLDTDLLIKFRPDIILTCRQTAHSAMLDGNLCDVALQSILGYLPKVVHCETNNMGDVWRNMLDISSALGLAGIGVKLVDNQKKSMSQLSIISSGRARPSVCCIQWTRPLMAGSAWVPELVSMSGGRDVCGRVEEAVMLSEEALLEASPDVIIFALCGIKLSVAVKVAQNVLKKSLQTLQRKSPAGVTRRIAAVDGNRILSRPGPWLNESLECLIEILHPEAQRFGHEDKNWQWIPMEFS
jgi:iron complex transport system substrate-binding protein